MRDEGSSKSDGDYVNMACCKYFIFRVCLHLSRILDKVDIRVEC